MKALNLSLRDERRALYLRIADAVREAVRGGQVQPGEPLPSTRDLAKVLRAHRHTVMNALDELVAEGWLTASARKSYRVTKALPVQFFAVDDKRKNASTIRPHALRIARAAPAAFGARAPSAYEHTFRSEAPDLRLFPLAEFKSHLAAALRHFPNKFLDYGDARGHGPLLDALEIYLRRLRAITGRTPIITHGAQEAIFLSAQLLIKPGDTVAVERLGYPPAWAALRAAGAELEALESDEEGLDPDSFERLARRHKIRLLYLTPLHQFPTMVTLPLARRMRIYDIAARHNIPILEDDYDHEFHYRCQPLAPLASNDPAGLVIYVSSFSKLLFPSLRIGFMAVPDSVAEAMTRYRRIITRQNDTIMQDAVARWMGDGGLERHLRRLTRVYEQRRDTMVQCLNAAKAAGHRLSFRVPDGGMAIWLNIFEDAERFAQKAAAAAILVQPESPYQLRRARATHLRLGFANQSPAEIKTGMDKLMGLMSGS